VAKSAFPVPTIHPFSNSISVIDAGRPQAARISKKAFTTTHGTRCRETRGIDMSPIATSGAFRNFGINFS
jgi:hypothetical protein